MQSSQQTKNPIKAIENMLTRQGTTAYSPVCTKSYHSSTPTELTDPISSYRYFLSEKLLLFLYWNESFFSKEWVGSWVIFYWGKDRLLCFKSREVPTPPEVQGEWFKGLMVWWEGRLGHASRRGEVGMIQNIRPLSERIFCLKVWEESTIMS